MSVTSDGLRDGIVCPICGETVACAIQSHVEKCLERFKRPESRDPRPEPCVCVVCRADITHLDASQRTSHVNRCLDGECTEPARECEAKATVPQNDRLVFDLLDCPLCERGFKTVDACKSHIKQCSVQLNMSPKQVVEAIRLQQCYVQQRLAVGLPVIHRRKTSADELSHRVSKRPRPLATIPKSKFQEDVQMAKALSASLTGGEQAAADGRSSRLVSNRASKRAKQVVKPTPVLLTTTNEERTARTEDRIARLLASPEVRSSQQGSLRNAMRGALRPSRRIKDLSEEGSSLLWTKAAQQGLQKESFYVAALESAVSPCSVEAGSKLRSLSQLPGHRISQAPNLGHLDVEYGHFIETQRPVKMEGTTQAHQAAVLSLLEESQNPRVADALAKLDQMAFGHGFLTQAPPVTTTKKNWEDDFLACLSSDLSGAVGLDRFSDLRISTAGGKAIDAHRIVLFCRCPAAERDVTMDDGTATLDWSEWPESCVTAFLKYVYGGMVDVCEKDQELAFQLRSMAFRYNMTALCRHLEELLEDALEEEAPLDASIAEIITSLWEEDPMPRIETEKTADADDADDGAFDDVYEFVASQRPKKSGSFAITSTDGGGGEPVPGDGRKSPQYLLPSSDRSVTLKVAAMPSVYSGSCSSPAKNLTPSRPIPSFPATISPIPSEDEHLQNFPVPPHHFSPSVPVENGPTSLSGIRGRDSDEDHVEDGRASDASSVELFESCDEAETDHGQESSRSTSEDESDSSRVRSKTSEEKGRPDPDINEDNIWNSVWEGFGDQDHCNTVHLVGNSADHEVDPATGDEELCDESIVEGEEETEHHDVPKAMLDSKFFEEEACSPRYRSPVRTTPEVLRDNNPAYHTPVVLCDGPGRQALPNCDVTPLPDYDAMQTPALKEQLHRFGVRAFPRKRAVNILKHIYEETHPYTTAASTAPPEGGQTNFEPSLSGTMEPGDASQSSTTDDDHHPEASSSSTDADLAESETRSDAEDCEGATSKMRTFLEKNESLYRKILSYEPVKLQKLHLDMKAAEIKVSVKTLMDFLDQQCITFTMPRNEKQRLKQRRRQERFKRRVRAKTTRQ